MNILKVNDTTAYLSDLDQFFLNKTISAGDRFGISWKVNKRRKLRTYTVLHYNHWVCDDCGPITEITVKKGNDTTIMDNHFGPSHLNM